MKTKIFNALKTEYKNLGLSDKALNGVASFLEKTVSDESGIDAAIKEVYVSELLKTYQSEVDTERQKASRANKDFEEYKKNHPDTNPEPPKTNEDSEVMKLLKQMQEDNNALRLRLDNADKAKSKAETIAAVRENLKKDNRGVDGLLNLILGNVEIGESDTVESLTAKYKDQYDSNYKALYGDGVVPPVGSDGGSTGFKPGMFDGIVNGLKEKGVLTEDSK